MIRAIMAVDANGGVGKNGRMPWPKHDGDMNWFVENTIGHIVVMGSNTWNSGLPKPLRKRINVVVSSKSEFPEAHLILPGINVQQEIINLSKQYPDLIVWIIGGSKLLLETIPIIDEFFLTRVNETYDCDTFIPIDQILSEFDLSWSKIEDTTTYEIWRRTIGSIS